MTLTLTLFGHKITIAHVKLLLRKYIAERKTVFFCIFYIAFSEKKKVCENVL
jgi:hypothetical protein